MTSLRCQLASHVFITMADRAKETSRYIMNVACGTKHTALTNTRSDERDYSQAYRVGQPSKNTPATSWNCSAHSRVGHLATRTENDAREGTAWFSSPARNHIKPHGPRSVYICGTGCLITTGPAVTKRGGGRGEVGKACGVSTSVLFLFLSMWSNQKSQVATERKSPTTCCCFRVQRSS